MKKLIIPLAVVTVMCSACSPLFYQQIATLSSDNVSLKNDGTYAYEDGLMTIEYDFWAESGQFQFIVTNNSDDDIYLNLAESYFVDNGYAHDYYQARTYVFTSKSIASAGTTASSAVAGTASVSAVASGQIINGDVVGAAASLAASKGYGASKSYSVASEKGASVEFTEKAIVCIPAHSYKVFEEFSVATSAFRECGFVRDPSKRENAVREYDGYTSPKVIENRLVFTIGDITIPVTNIFYVSQYQNISTENATEIVKMERCDGFKKDVRVHKLSANNKFYITYSKNEIWATDGNDRVGHFYGR
jgi:hypothetical protein